MPPEEEKNQDNPIQPAPVQSDPAPEATPQPSVEPPIAPPPMNFDDPSPQSQQVDQGSQSLPVSPPIQPNIAWGSTPQIVDQPSSPETKSSKGKLIGIVLSFFVATLLIAAIGGTYYFWLVPQAKAKEYISAVGADIASINKNLNALSSIFTQIENPLERGEEALNEITMSRNYTDAQKDTKEDIADIKKSLDLVETAAEQKSKIQIRSNDISELNGLVENYFSTSGEALKALLTHQEFQMKMLDSYGDVLETELQKIDEILAGTDHKTAVTYFQNLTAIAKQSYERINLIAVIPPEEAEYLNIKKEYLQDLTTTSDLLAKLYSEDSTNSDKTAEKAIEDFGTRNQERNGRVSQHSQNFVSNSQAKKKFDESKDLYKKIIDKINELKAKYKVDLEIEDDSSQLPEATTSANQATTSANATDSASASKSATTSATLKPQPR